MSLFFCGRPSRKARSSPISSPMTVGSCCTAAFAAARSVICTTQLYGDGLLLDLSKLCPHAHAHTARCSAPDGNEDGEGKKPFAKLTKSMGRWCSPLPFLLLTACQIAHIQAGSLSNVDETDVAITETRGCAVQHQLHSPLSFAGLNFTFPTGCPVTRYVP